MSLAMIISGLSAYGMNSWVVKRGLKHGMMTVRKKGRSMHEHHNPPQVSSKEIKNKLLLSLLALAIGF